MHSSGASDSILSRQLPVVSTCVMRERTPLPRLFERASVRDAYCVCSRSMVNLVEAWVQSAKSALCVGIQRVEFTHVHVLQIVRDSHRLGSSLAVYSPLVFLFSLNVR